MKHFFAFFCLAVLSCAGLQAQSRLWLFFTDKGCAEGVSPSLSPDALQRRSEAGISMDEKDFPVSSEYISALQKSGLRVAFTSRWLNAVSVETDLNPQELMNQFSFIREVKPVRALRSALAGPSAPLPSGVSVSSLSYGASLKQTQMIALDQLHDLGFTGNGIKIAVFDAGFYGMDTLAAFDSLWLTNRVKLWKDFVDGDTLVFQEDQHGMFIMATLASNLPGQLVGTAPHASFFLARTENVFSETHAEEDNWVAAVEWADSLGAHQIQSSLGYSVFDPGEGDYTYSQMDGNTTIITKAADIAASRGILVVSAAGNEGAGPWHYITAPCDADSILCIGSVDSLEMHSAFSSYGPSADGRVKPDVMSMGQDAATMLTFGAVGFLSGTSLAAPIISGLAASLWSAHPARSNMEIIDAIKRSADRYAVPDTAYGYGIPNAMIADSILTVLDSVLAVGHPTSAAGGYTLYPNPAAQEIFLQGDQNAEPLLRWEIVSVSGAKCAAGTFTDPAKYMQVDIAGLAPGLYAARLTTVSGRSWSLKFMHR